MVGCFCTRLAQEPMFLIFRSYRGRNQVPGKDLLHRIWQGAYAHQNHLNEMNASESLVTYCPYLFGCHWRFWLLFLFVFVRGPRWGCILLGGPDHRPPYIYRFHLRP